MYNLFMTLNEYFEQNGIKPGTFQREKSIKHPYIYRYLKGTIPRPEIMQVILEATNGAVTPNDFYLSSEIPLEHGDV